MITNSFPANSRLRPSSVENSKRGSLVAGACAIGAFGLSSMQAGAAPITVLNHSFETRKLDNYGNPRNNPTDWAPEAFADSTRQYGSNIALAPIDGVRALTFNNNYIVYQAAQKTDFVVTQAGQVLTLTVGVGNYSRPHQLLTGGGMKAEHYYGTINLQLLDENDVAVDVATNAADNLNAFTPTAPAASFADAWLIYTTTAADIGKSVGIHFNIGQRILTGYTPQGDPTYQTKQAYFDNVRLDVASPIPEPSALLMMVVAIAVLGIARFRRRKHASARI